MKKTGFMIVMIVILSLGVIINILFLGTQLLSGELFLGASQSFLPKF